MSFALSDEQMAMQESVRGFIERYAGRKQTALWDEEGEYPMDLYTRMADQGWLGINVPESYGGTGGSIMDLVVIYEALARYSVDIPTRLALTYWGQMNLLTYGTEAQRDRYLAATVAGEQPFSFCLSEPDSGSDAASLRTTARLDGDEWVLNGSKIYATGASLEGNIMVVACRTDPEAPKHKGISMLMVPTDAPGVEVRKMRTIGRHIVATNEVYFTDARVPADALLGPLGGGWKCVTSHLERERLTLAAMYLGNAGGATDDALGYAKEREQFGRPIGSNQVIKHMLADMDIDLEAGRWLTYNAAWRYDQGLPCARESTIAKIYVSEMWNRNAQRGMQILGGAAYTTDHAMQRYFRDARNGTVGGGTSQILRDVLGRGMGL